MAALVASSAGAEWEMVYMVSWVAMPTMAALVVMLARWKGKKPTPNAATPPSFSAKCHPPEAEKSDAAPPQQCRKRTGKAQRKERHEKIVRRVTSCPDFAVVRVMKTDGKTGVKTGFKKGRQLSFANLKDRRLQEEIARLADKLLERGCEWGQGHEGEWGQPDVGDCGFDRAHECDCIGGKCEQMGFRQGGSLADWGKKACASLEALLARRAAAMQRKRAEYFLTKGTQAQGGFRTVPGGPVQAAVAPPRMGSRDGMTSKQSFVAATEIDRLGYYNQLRPNVCVWGNAPCLVGELRRLAESSAVRFWANEGVSNGVNGTEQMGLSKPGFSGLGFGDLSFGLWSVTSKGVVENWDSRVSGAPLLQHVLPLQPVGVVEVGGLNMSGSQLRIQLTNGGTIAVDARKCQKVLG